MEDNDINNSNLAWWKKWWRKNHKVVISLISILVFLVVLHVVAKVVLGNLLKSSIEKASDYKYEFNYNSFRYNVFTNNLIFKDVSFKSNSDADTLKILKSVEVGYISLKGFKLFNFLADKEIEFKELAVKGTDIYLINNQKQKPTNIEQDPVSKDTIQNSTPIDKMTFHLKEFFQKHAVKFGVEKFDFQNGNLHLEKFDDSLHSLEINDFNLYVEGILLTDSILQTIDSVFFFNDFDFSLGKNCWNPAFQGRNLNLEFDSLYYSSKNKTIVAENLDFKNAQEATLINVNFPYFSVQNLDFEQILNTGQMKFDTLQLIDTKLELNIVETQKKSKTDSSWIEKIIEKRSPITLKHIVLKNNFIDFNYDFYNNEQDWHVQSFIDLYIDGFELDKSTFETKKHQLFSDNFKVTLSGTEIAQKGNFETSFSDLKWETKERNLFLNNIEYQSFKESGLKMIQLDSFQVKDVDVDQFVQSKKIEAQLLHADKGKIVVKNKNRQKEKEPSFSFTLPKNDFVENITIQSVDLNNISFENRDAADDKKIDINNIDLRMKRLNIHQKQTYPIFDFKFCQNIAGSTENANILLKDRFHQLSWTSLSTDFDKKIRFKDFSMNTIDDPQKLLKESVVLPPSLIQAQSEILEISKFNFGLFFKYGIVNVESIYSNVSDIHIYKTEFSAVKKQKNPFTSVDIESIIFEHGNFAYSKSDFSLSVNDFLVNVDILSIPEFDGKDVNYKFNNIVFEYQQQNLKTSTISLSSNGLKLNHRKELFEIASILLTSKQPQKALQDLTVDIKQLDIHQFDFLSLIYDKVFYANNLTVGSTKISGLLDESLQIAKDSSSKSSYLLQQMLIRNVNLPDIQVDFSMIDKKHAWHHFTFNKSDLEMKHVNWTPTMEGFPHKGKLKFNLRNIVAEKDNKNGRTIVDSVFFSVSPEIVKVYGTSFDNLKENEVLNSLNLQRITVISPDLDKLVTSGEFKSDKILLNNGEIAIDLSSFNASKDKKETQHQKDTGSSAKKSNSTLNNILNNIVFNNIRLKLIQNNRHQTITLKNGAIEKNNGSTITIDALNFKVNDNLSDAGFKKVYINSKNKRIIIDSCYLTPTLTKEEWAAHFDYQKDWTKLSAKNIILEGVDIEDFLNQTHKIPMVRINRMKLEDYRDKRKPFPKDHFPLMLQDMLRNVQRPFLVDSLIVTSSEFTYEEQVEHTLQPGKVFFTKAGIFAGNITNDSNHFKEPMLIMASMMLMDSVKLTSQLSFSLDDSTNYFTAAAQLEPFEMNILNPTLENLAFLSIKEGFCNGLEMDFHGNNTYSLGSIQFLYQDFKIGLIDKKKLKPDAGTNFLSFLANAFIVKRANPIAFFPRNGIIYFERDPHKSIFNYLFKSSLAGIKHTIGLRESKASKDKKSENYLNYEQERKEIIKNYRFQKKEERKSIKESHKSTKNN